MRSKWPLIAAVVAAGVVAAGVVAAVGIALGGSSSSTSKAAYEAKVVNARDRVDFALQRITKAKSTDEVISRMRDASTEVGSAANELQNADVANGFGDENAKLVSTLRAFSTELSNTADTFADPTLSGTLSGASLAFKQWDAVNAVLVEMKAKGIEVSPLQRHLS